MATSKVQDGDVIDRTLAGTVAVGAVIAMGHTIGIALKAGVSGDIIPVGIRGAFTVPKVSAAVWVQGEKLLWDASAGAFDDSAATPASGDIMGAVVARDAGANTETTAVVVLTPGNATLTP
jgi:predicted RecA/RadA family phage recombinase